MGLFSFVGDILGDITGTNKQAKAAGKAADVQAAQAQAAIDETKRQFDTTQRNFQPYLSSGSAANRELMALLGLPDFDIASDSPANGGITGRMGAGPYRDIAAAAPAGVDWEAYVRGNPDALAQWNSQTPDLAPFGGDINSFGAFHYQNDGARRDLSSYQLPTSSGSAIGNGQERAIAALKDSPLFRSLYRTGEEAILANGAATGGLRGGNIQRSLADFGSDTLAKVIQDRIANLSGVVNLGQNSAAGVGNLGAQKSASIADLLGQQGAARAGGIIAQGNKQANALASGLNLASSIAGFF